MKDIRLAYEVLPEHINLYYKAKIKARRKREKRALKEFCLEIMEKRNEERISI